MAQTHAGKVVISMQIPLLQISGNLTLFVLVTGASGGFGRALTALFVSKGAKVLANDISEQGGAALVKEHGEDNVHFVAGDVTTAETWALMRDEALKKFGRIDVLLVRRFTSFVFFKFELTLRLFFSLQNNAGTIRKSRPQLQSIGI